MDTGISPYVGQLGRGVLALDDEPKDLLSEMVVGLIRV